MVAATKEQKRPASTAPTKSAEPEPQFGEMRKVRLRFTGVTPLIQHNAKGMRTEESVKGMNKKVKEHLTGAAEAETGLYRTVDGKFYHPAEAFRDAIIESGVGSKIGKKSASDTLMSGLFVLHDEAILLDPKTGKPFQDDKENPPWAVDTRTVVNPNTGGRIERSRPIWNHWSCEVEFEYDPFILGPEIILQAAQLAGMRIGVGQLRPCPKKKDRKRGRGGRYGKFKAEIVKE